MEKITNRFQLLLLLILFGAFSSFGQNQVTGTLTYHDNWGMDNSTVYLMDLNNIVLDSCATNPAGEYVFNNVAPGDYLLTASTNLSAGGVDLGDAFLIMLHLYGMYSFTDVQELAADVNGSGTVTWADYFTIVVGWFNYGYPFPVGDWVFETVPVTVTSSRDGGGSGGDLGSSSTGDVGGMYIPDKNFPISPIDYLKSEMPVSSNSAEYTITLSSAKAMGGFHLSIPVPVNIEVQNITSELNLNTTVSDGMLNITWIDTDMLYNVADASITLDLICKENTEDIKLECTRSTHFIDVNGEILYGVELKFDEIELVAAEDAFETSVTIGPNPCIDRTNVWITSPVESQAVLVIFDGNGNLVRKIDFRVDGSENQQISLDLSFLSAGMYHYRITDINNTFVESGSMIKLR